MVQAPRLAALQVEVGIRVLDTPMRLGRCALHATVVTVPRFLSQAAALTG